MNKPVLKNEIKAEIKGIATVEDNINEAKEYALQLKEYYSTLVFTDDQIKEAKGERASINKVITKISTYRKDIIAEYKKPIEQFEKSAKETESILKETADFVDVQVKAVEEKEKADKKIVIESIFNDNVAELKEALPLATIFDEKWLNKTVAIADVEEAIKNHLNKIRTELKAIEELHSEFEFQLKTEYLRDFNISSIILRNNQLKSQKEALANVEVKKEEIKQETIEKMVTEKVASEDDDPIKTYTLKITGELSKMEALLKFLQLNKMTTTNIETGKTIVD